MASKPGPLTDWPWKPLGSLKYVVLAPWVVRSTYVFANSNGMERDMSTFLIFPFMLWRILHNQIWITLSRYRNARGNGRIVDKGIEFEQVDRERDWDDQILFNHWGDDTCRSFLLAGVEIRRCDNHDFASRQAGGVPILLAS
ncbi:hypothetical protein NL676_012059 [Syzygium grande]|nr:hypothetical protein NL676_012059 [Syzygium grande]